MTLLPSLTRRVLWLAWPIVLARLGMISMGVCDAVVVGRLAPHELAHQALGWAPTSVVLLTSVGLLTGVQLLGARVVGSNAVEQAGGAFQRGLAVSALSSTLSITLVYLGGERMLLWFGIEASLAGPASQIARVVILSVPLHLAYICGAYFAEATGRPVASMSVMWMANLLNLGLDLTLVPRLGALGAAWATVAARAFLAMALLAWLCCQRDATRFGLRRYVALPSFAVFLRVGSAAAVSQAAESSAFAGMAIMAGRLGAPAAASFQVLLNVLTLSFMVALGFASATAIVTAEAVGRGSEQEALRASWVGLAINSVLLTGAAVLVRVLAVAIAAAYTVDANVARRVAESIPLVAVAMVLDGGQAVTAAALRAHGDNWFPAASHLLAYVIAMPALGVLLTELQGQGLPGLMLAIMLASALSLGVLAMRLWRLVSVRRRGAGPVSRVRPGVPGYCSGRWPPRFARPRVRGTMRCGARRE